MLSQDQGSRHAEHFRSNPCSLSKFDPRNRLLLRNKPEDPVYGWKETAIRAMRGNFGWLCSDDYPGPPRTLR